MKTTSTIGKRIAAAVGALAVGVAGLALGATAANAAPSVGNINPVPGSLTIHKYAGNPNTGNTGAGKNDGNEITDAQQKANLGTALQGVKFVVRSVQVKQSDNSFKDIDLNTYEGWEQVKGLDSTKFNADGSYPGGNYQLGWTSGDKVTGADGSVKVPDLVHTLYYVAETDASGAKNAAGNPVNVVQKSQPFLVTVPFPQSNNSDQWIYDIHAYPKNALVDTPTKTVADPGNQLAMGDTVDWSIDVPLTRDGGDYTKFIVKDQLDAAHLTANTKDIVVTLDDQTTPLQRNVDYTVTPSQDVEAAVTGTPVVVTFTSAGLAKINALRVTNGSHKVHVKLTTKVKALSSDGTITNTGTTITNNGSGDNEQETNEAQVNHGSLLLTKKSDIEGLVLAGAQFELWTANGNAIGQKVSDTIYTTGEDGTLRIDGIWTGTSVTGDNTTTRDYYLKEVKAPAGYILPDDPTTRVTIKTNGVTTPTTVEVKNKQNNGPNLPLTGSAGTVMLLAVGAALVLGGTVTSQIARKNRKSAQVR